MKRRSFLATLGLVVASPKVLLGMGSQSQPVRTGILRRKEYKRKRWYKRRAARRTPLSRLLKECYENFRLSVTPVVTPFITQLQRGVRADDYIVWGGQNHYYDLAVTGPATTRDTLVAAPAHSGGTGTASSRRFFRSYW